MFKHLSTLTLTFLIPIRTSAIRREGKRTRPGSNCKLSYSLMLSGLFPCQHETVPDLFLRNIIKKNNDNKTSHLSKTYI